MKNQENKIKWQVVRADLHNHLSTGSDLSHIDFNRVVNITRTRLGKGGILGIANFEDYRYEEFIEKPGYHRQSTGNAIWVPERDVFVVKCQEVPTRDCHILLVGLEQGVNLKSGLPLGNTLSGAKERALTTILPHPGTYQGVLKRFDEWIGMSKRLGKKIIFDLPKFIKDNVHAIEVYNAQAALGIPRFANTKAKLFQEDMVKWGVDIGAIASSDGHSVREIGRTYTELIIPRYEHMKSKHLIKYHLKEAINSAKRFQGRKQPARLEAVEHAVALVYCILKDKLSR